MKQQSDLRRRRARPESRSPDGLEIDSRWTCRFLAAGPLLLVAHIISARSRPPFLDHLREDTRQLSCSVRAAGLTSPARPHEAAPMTITLKNSPAFWAELIAAGGLEPKERDLDMVADIEQRLGLELGTLEAALPQTKLDDLVRAIFGGVAPFGAMYRDILNFFKAAAAKKGRHELRLELDDIPFDLKHLEAFGEAIAASTAFEILPLLSVMQAFRMAGALEMALQGVEHPPLAEDVQQWLDSSQRGKLDPFPASLRSGWTGPSTRAAAMLTQASLTFLREQASTIEACRLLLTRAKRDDIFDPPAAAGIANDLWFNRMIAALAHTKQLSREAAMEVENQLASFLEPFVLQPVMIDAAPADLRRLLSLPAWKQRYELYAVWVAVEIVNCLPDHECTIHTSNGVLEFGFCEKTLATFKGRRDKTELVAERKSRLIDPLGKSRKGNAQPDYGLWRDGTCTLVVEVKHYKRVAKRSFSEVLVDYARAHPEAEVVLVNYGPTGDSIDSMQTARDIAGRCQHIPYLNPLNDSARQQLKELVIEGAGPPPASGLLLLDVSASMSHAFESSYGGPSEIASWLRSSDLDGINEVVFADTEERWRGSLEEAKTKAQSWTPSRGTALVPLLGRLLADRSEIMVATDLDGILEMESDPIVKCKRKGRRMNLYLATVTSTGK